MAMQTGPPPIEDDGVSDLAEVWRDAMASYYKATGQSLDTLPRFRDVDSIMDYAQRETDLFDKFRHPPSKVDKLRSLLKANVGYIEAGAQQIAAAATPAFPPAAAIMTAFTYLLQAAKDVSADYDVIVSFFDEMKSLLERVSIIEKRLPNLKSYKTILGRVFGSFLEICGISTVYVKKKRFKKWVKALFEGEDDELQAAKGTMETNIKRLESATLFVAARNTEDIHKDTTQLKTATVAIQSEMTMVATTTSDVKEDTNLLVMANERIESALQALVVKQQSMARRERHPQQHKSGSDKKHTAFNSVKSWFAPLGDPALIHQEVGYFIVAGTNKWLLEHEKYDSWKEGQYSFLWLEGPPGIGKTTMSHSIINDLNDAMRDDPASSVAYFYFREEEPDRRSAMNAIRSVIVQVAAQSTAFCEFVAAEISRDNDNETNYEDPTDLWNRYLVVHFAKDCDTHLFLVLDGFDETSLADQVFWVGLLKYIRETSLKISVLLTCRASLGERLVELELPTLAVKKEDLATDMKALIRSSFRTLPRIRKFHPETKRIIYTKILEHADGMLYVDHIMRRLNSIGRETVVLRDLEKPLPADMRALYALLLSEASARRSDASLKALKTLFAWLAYSHRAISLQEAEEVVKMVADHVVLDLDAEIEGRSASLLELEIHLDEDEEDFFTEEPSTKAKPVDDATVPLGFQERSLREYFRESNIQDTALRTLPTAAHLLIFDMSVQVLCSAAEAAPTQPGSKLLSYAGLNAHRHMMAIDIAATSDAEAVRAIELISSIMTDANGYSAGLEACMVVTNNDQGRYKYEDHDGKLFEALQSWKDRLAKITTPVSNVEAKEWLHATAEDKEALWVVLARGHIVSWFNSTGASAAKKAFNYAFSALVLIGALKQPSAERRDKRRTVKEILLVAEHFADIEKDPKAYLAISLVLYSDEHYKAALKQSTRCLDLRTEDKEMSFRALVHHATVLCELEEYAKSYEHIKEALNLRPDSGESPTQASMTTAQEALLLRGQCEFQLDMTDAALASYEEARLRVPSRVMSGKHLRVVTDALYDSERYDGLLPVLEKWSFMERLTTMCYEYDYSDVTWNVLDAAARTHQVERLVKVYQEIIEFLDKHNAAAPFQLELAHIHAKALGDTDAAKNILYDMLNTTVPPPSNYLYTNADSTYISLISQERLLDILFDDFRAAKDPHTKLAMLQEAHAIPDLPLARALPMSESDGIERQIPLALMTRKVGSLLEYQNIMETTFRRCTAALSDSVGWNDMINLAALARVLACMPGLERESRIALSAMFSRLDPAIKDDEDDEDEDEEDEDEEEDKDKNGDEDPDEDNWNDEDSDPIDKTLPWYIAPGDQDLVTGQDTTCSGYLCQHSTWYSSWNRGPLYTCIYCVSEDLCRRCYKGRKFMDRSKAHEAGTTPTPQPKVNGSSGSATEDHATAGAEHLANGTESAAQASSSESAKEESGAEHDGEGSGEEADDDDEDDEGDDDDEEDDNEENDSKQEAKNEDEDKDEDETPWVSYCGYKHRFIKAPVEDWRGIKDGVMTLGDEKIEFKVWLEQVKGKWKDAWGVFWSDDGYAGGPLADVL